jgi:hypothetical protein
MRGWLIAAVMLGGCGPGPQRPVVVGPAPQSRATPAGRPTAVAVPVVSVAAPVKVAEEVPEVPAVVPVYEISVVSGKVRARWQDRVGAVAAPPVPKRYCCEWTARAGAATPGRMEVVVDVTLACDGLHEFCEGVVAEPTRAQVTVPLTADAPAKPRYRGLPDSVVDRMPDALGPKQQLANMLSVGPFGPAPDGVLVLQVDDVGDAGRVPADDDRRAAAAGPGAGAAVGDARGDRHRVRGRGRRRGRRGGGDGERADGDRRPGTEEFSGAHVLKWDGTQLVSLPRVEQRMLGATTPGEVRWRLQRLAK